jgi:trehalose utilization protein
VFRSGLTYQRGAGRIFYFRPGHEAYPSYHDPCVQRVLANAVQWAAPRVNLVDRCPMAAPLEKIAQKDVVFQRLGVVQTHKDLQ